MRILKNAFWCSDSVPFTDMRISSIRFLVLVLRQESKAVLSICACSIKCRMMFLPEAPKISEIKDDRRKPELCKNFSILFFCDVISRMKMCIRDSFCTFRCRMESELLGPEPISFLSCWVWFFRWYVCGAGEAAALSISHPRQSARFGRCWCWELLRLPCSLLSFSEETVMHRVGKFIGCCLIAVSLLACTACSVSIG